MKGFGMRLLPLLLTFCILTGCTVIPTLEGRNRPNNAPVTLTMLCHWDCAQAKTFVEGVRAKLPHITLDLEVCPIGALPYDDEVTRRVLHGTEADIFMTVDTDLWSCGKLLDFTDEAFVSRYQLSLMKSLSGDGSAYFVPGLGDVLCYLYNAKWLDEVGLAVPQTKAELDGVLAAIQATGKQPFLVPYSQMPTQYVKVLMAGDLSTPKGQQWLNDYCEGKITMAQDAQWQKVWSQVEELTQKGYLRAQDLVYTESRRIVAAQEEGAFMTTFSSSQYGKISEKNKAQFQLLPLLGDKVENQMVYTAPTCYFAVSNRLADAANAAKRAAALQVLDLISTPEGQNLLRGNNPLAISYLEDTMLPIHDQCANLEQIIRQGAYTQVPTFGRGVEKVIGEMFGKLVEGKATAQEAIRACDAQQVGDVADKMPEPLPVLGIAAETFPWTYMQSRTGEMAIVNFCMDSVRKATGSDYALELGTAFRSELFQGELTAADVESVIRQEKKLYLVEITGQQIWDLINQGVTPQRGCAWFIAPSGFRYSYQRLADGSGKLVAVTLEDGTPLDLQKTFSVVVSENQIMNLPDVVNFSQAEKRELPITLREAVTAHIQELGIIFPKTDGRIQIVTP